jgi:predicted Zn-dependent peptidase
LLDFVQAPYFTEETVEKEKGIIAEEIKMYDDNADFKTYFGILNNLFVNHPIKIDIAGTVESVYETTAEDLHVCYDTFYHPSNMILFVVGDINPEEVLESIKKNQAQKEYPDAKEIKRFFPEEPETVATRERTIKMQVSTPKAYVGIKGVLDKSQSPREILAEDMALDVMLEIAFGTSSDYYEKVIESGLANESFGFEATHEPSFSFALVGSDTEQPDEFIQSVVSQLETLANREFNLDEFESMKRKKIGRLLSALNSVEFIANRFTEYAFDGLSLFDVAEVLEEMTLADIQKVAKSFYDEKRMTIFKILPDA